MKFLTILSTFIFVIILTNQLSFTKAEQSYIDESILRSVSMAMFFIPYPMGPVLGVFSGLITEIYVHVKHKNSHYSLLKTDDFALRIEGLNEYIKETSQLKINQLTQAIYRNKLVANYRNDLEFIKSCFEGMCDKCLVKRTCAFNKTQSIVNLLTDPGSDYREILSGFVSNYISTPNSPIISAADIKFIFDILVNNHKIQVNSHRDCDNHISEHTKIYEIAVYTMKIMARSYGIVTLAYMYKSNENLRKNDIIEMVLWENEILVLLEDLHTRITDIVTTAHAALQKTSRDIRRCLPAIYKKGVTFERLTNFIQAEPYNYICFGPVSSHGTSSNKGVVNDEIFGKQNNNNTIFDCKKINELNTVYFNRTSEQPYQYFSIETDPKIWSQSRIVNGIYGQYSNTNLLERRHFGDMCSIEICYVDMKFKKNSVRRISSAPVLAPNGWVVTGIQWMVKNYIIYPQIQVAELLNAINIKPDSVTWLPTAPENYNETLLLDVDNRSFNFDDVILPAGSYVTGFQFIRTETKQKSISIQVHGLAPNKSTIIQNAEDNNNRSEIKLDHDNAPEYSTDNYLNVVESNPGKHWLKFQPTDFGKDTGRTTVPYLDIQPVFTFPPTPIGGIGTYFRGVKGYGGFIGLKLLSIDVSAQLNPVKWNNFANDVMKYIEKLQYLTDRERSLVRL